MKKENTNYAEKILSAYTEKGETEIDALRKLDKKVRGPVKVFSYVLGSLSAIIMGAGMSLIMTDIGEIIGIKTTMPIGLTFGIVGLVLAILNYPVHKKIMTVRKKKYAPEIAALCDKLNNV